MTIIDPEAQYKKIGTEAQDKKICAAAQNKQTGAEAQNNGSKCQLPAFALAVVMPCYNEQEALPIALERILAILDQMMADGIINANSFVLCCDDGSTDGTWSVIEDFNKADARVKGISLASNVGHQYALLAGLREVRGKCDASISIDADMQDDPAAIIEMAKAYREGADIVFGVRSSRSSDSWFKRVTAHAFYKLQKAMGVRTIYDHADYRLMSSRALDILAEYPERNLFLRGIISQIGLKTAVVSYERKPRVAGKSKYPLAKMLALSIDGITSFSVTPIRIIFAIGLIFLLLALAMSIYSVIAYFKGNTIPGWTSMMISMWFMGSLILIGLGIIGEYISKIYIETKHRPRYFITKRK